MRKILVTALLACPLAVFAAPNLVTNGSFETGLSGWTQGGVVGGGFPAVAINSSVLTIVALTLASFPP